MSTQRLIFFSHPECVADYGAPPKEWKPSDTIAAPEGTGAVHTIMVAPMEGVLKYSPFSINASVGDTICYVWSTPANHTTTLSSALAPCNRSARVDKLKWVSGIRNTSQGTQTCMYPHLLGRPVLNGRHCALQESRLGSCTASMGFRYVFQCHPGHCTILYVDHILHAVSSRPPVPISHTNRI